MTKTRKKDNSLSAKKMHEHVEPRNRLYILLHYWVGESSFRFIDVSDVFDWFVSLFWPMIVDVFVAFTGSCHQRVKGTIHIPIKFQATDFNAILRQRKEGAYFSNSSLSVTITLSDWFHSLLLKLLREDSRIYFLLLIDWLWNWSPSLVALQKFRWHLCSADWRALRPPGSTQAAASKKIVAL